MSYFVNIDVQRHVLNLLIPEKLLLRSNDITATCNQFVISLRREWICCSRFWILFKFLKDWYDLRGCCDFIFPNANSFHAVFNLLLKLIDFEVSVNTAVNWRCKLSVLIMLVKVALRHHGLTTTKKKKKKLKKEKKSEKKSEKKHFGDGELIALFLCLCLISYFFKIRGLSILE